jgi:23S rRNA (uracil1939-C5)-methyltransferase
MVMSLEANTLAEGKIIELSIEKLLYQGSSLAHYGSMACFINDVIPGETVRARIAEIKKQYAVALLMEILHPSPHRINPPCPLVPECGGCQLQHIEYNHQLYWKAAIIKECLERIGSIKHPTLLSPLPSPSFFHYRSRAVLRSTAGQNPLIGFYRHGTHQIISVQECMLLVPELNYALAECWRVANEHSHLFSSASDLQLLYSSASQQVLISARKGFRVIMQTVFEPGKKLSATSFSNQLPATSPVGYEDIMGITFKRTNSSFYQVNMQQNTALIKLVLTFLSPERPQKILDLYCGCGNFSLFLAREGAAVVGIDVNSHAINEAQQNYLMNNLQNCTFLCGKVEMHLRQIKAHACQSILVNPSRQGCSTEVIAHVVRISPRVIVYVSCNPATLARDLKRLVQHGYDIAAIQPVDMFPQTYHIETVVKLVKSQLN